jgi:hypothetical protein
MTRKVGLALGIFVVAMCLIAVAAGIVLLATANRLPSHIDELRATELSRRYEENYTRSTSEQRERIEREIADLRTPKWTLYTAGLDMCLVSSCLLLTIFWFRLWDMRNLRRATTPRTRWGLLGLAGAAWWALLPALQLQSHDDYARDDLTWAIDTGHGSLWFVAPKIFLFIFVVILAVGRFVVLRHVLMPVNLWLWDSGAPRRSLTLTVLYGLLGGSILVLIAWSAVGFPWALPSLLVGLYVVLSSRAASVGGGKYSPHAV